MVFSPCSLAEISPSWIEGTDPKIVEIAAVYWTNAKVSTNGGVYASGIITDLASAGIQSECEAILADAAWAYIVTWHAVVPNQDTVDELKVRTCNS